MKVNIFEKDGKRIWESSTGMLSMCIKVVTESFDRKTLIFNEETTMNWVKSRNPDRIEEQTNQVMELIKAGKLVPYRTFSLSPRYEGHEQVVNPTTGESLGKYSTTSLGTPEEASALNRTFVEPEVIEAPVITSPEVGVTA